MIISKLGQALLTLLIGVTGASLFAFLQWPSPWLVGAMLFVALAKLAGAPLWLPRSILGLVQTVLGLAVGLHLHIEGIDSTLMIGLAGMTLCVFSQVPLLYRWYHRRLGWPPEESLLASTPGALGIMLVLADNLPNPTRVALAQSTRLLTLVTLVSLVLFLQQSNMAPNLRDAGPTLAWLPLIGAVMGGILGGRLMQSLHVPVPYLLAGIVAGLLCTQWQGTALAMPAGTPEFIMLGLAAYSGSRFTRLPAHELRQTLMAGALGCLLAAMISLLWALLTSYLTGLSLLQVWLAYAPGGLEAMILMAMASGMDTTWVTLHHVTRLILLSVGPALWLSLRQGSSQDRTV